MLTEWPCRAHLETDGEFGWRWLFEVTMTMWCESLALGIEHGPGAACLKDRIEASARELET